MTTPSSALTALSSENEVFLPLERMAKIILEHWRELPNLAKEGKITDVQMQQLQDLVGKVALEESVAAGLDQQQRSNTCQASVGELKKTDISNELDISGSSSEEDEDVDEDEDAVDDTLLPDPIVSVDALRCVECAWEIVDCFCQSCGLEHNEYDGDDPAYPDTTPTTYDDILHVDRHTFPRGSTPLAEIDPAAIIVPAEYARRKEMYYN
ncbi:hypothetical protein PENSPDRAFT_314084 [Peniophora sp. CONT]|nr:hypothetical protein PENSPDRAFT_314084 [Peniophora sp. CONT]